MSKSNASTSVSNGQREKPSQGAEDDRQGRWRNKIFKYISAARFMGSYYLMLITCLGSLVYILGEEAGLPGDSVERIYDMEVTSGIMLGLFAILATFTVVFFALRAEEAATNSSSSIVQEIVDKTFNDEEEAIAEALRDADRNTGRSSLIENEPDTIPVKKLSLPSFAIHKRDSIYFGVDKRTAQGLIWISVLLVTIFSIYLAHNFSAIPYLLRAQSLIAWSIGILGILVTLTIVLFALRAARFSQIAGRIASYSVIERMATSHEKEYHNLLDVFLALLVQEKLLVVTAQYHYALINAPDKTLDRLEQDVFNLRRKCEQYLLYGVSFLLAFAAIFTAGCFMFFIGKPEFNELSMNLILILFVFLISFTTLFFSGRVVLSAIGSSEIQATEMTRLELEHQKKRLYDRITSVEKIKSVLGNYLGADPKAAGKIEVFKEHADRKGYGLFEEHLFDLLAAARQKVDDQIKDIVQIRMHLRHLRAVGARKDYGAGENKQFRWICDYLAKLWTAKFEEMDGLLFFWQMTIPLGGEQEGVIIREISKARQEDKILMKLQQEQVEKQNLTPGASAEISQKILNHFGKISLLRLNFDKDIERLMARWKKIKIESHELEERYEKEATSVNLNLRELKNSRKHANKIFTTLLSIVRLELTIARISKAVSDLPHFLEMEEVDNFRGDDWPYVKFLQKLNPVFLDAVGPEPILTDYNLSALEEIKRAPELFEILHRDNHPGSG